MFFLRPYSHKFPHTKITMKKVLRFCPVYIFRGMRTAGVYRNAGIAPAGGGGGIPESPGASDLLIRKVLTGTVI